ncbi:MAG: acylglycerol kinase family protein [Sphingomonas sp.]|nr:acylglycerol kinase family protein [Sphingomonas sp.]MBW0007186.1 acylglycerol kinase family protein [Sphingomonas sp.]
MLKVERQDDASAPTGQACVGPAWVKPRVRIALLSNPRSTGNLAQLPKIREYCADHPDVFHYEVEDASQIGEAIRSIARVRPKVLAINGGDGTVQAALTELYNGNHFGDAPPPVAVLPSGKTNLIALDLGARGDPVETLERLIELARSDDLAPYTVARELIALRHGEDDKPVIGMFLGGAGLADTMLYCRDKIYPLGLPNSVAHALTAIAAAAKQILRLKASFLPPDSKPVSVSFSEQVEPITGRFSVLAVTTLEKLLLSTDFGAHRQGTLKLLTIEAQPETVIGAVFAKIVGKFGREEVRGVRFEEANEITIHGDNSNVILDGETFRAVSGSPINLRPAQPLSFVKLAA